MNSKSQLRFSIRRWKLDKLTLYWHYLPAVDDLTCIPRNIINLEIHLCCADDIIKILKVRVTAHYCNLARDLQVFSTSQQPAYKGKHVSDA